MLAWLDGQLDDGELTSPSDHTIDPTDPRRGTGDRFPPGDLRLTKAHVNAQLTSQSRFGDLDVQLPHPSEEHLSRLWIRLDRQGRVLRQEPVQSPRQGQRCSLILRLDPHKQHRLGEANGAKADGVFDAVLQQDIHKEVASALIIMRNLIEAVPVDPRTGIIHTEIFLRDNLP